MAILLVKIKDRTQFRSLLFSWLCSTGRSSCCLLCPLGVRSRRLTLGPACREGACSGRPLDGQQLPRHLQGPTQEVCETLGQGRIQDMPHNTEWRRVTRQVRHLTQHCFRTSRSNDQFSFFAFQLVSKRSDHAKLHLQHPDRLVTCKQANKQDRDRYSDLHYD